MTQGKDPTFVDFVVGLIVISILMCMSAFATKHIVNRAWKLEAVAHGAATYVLEKDEAVFKWKDQVEE